MGHSKWLAGLIAFPIWIGLISACGGSASPAISGTNAGQAARPGGPTRIVAAIASEPVAVRYAMQTQLGSQTPGVDALEDLLTAGLAIVDNRGVLRPQLAESAPTIANGAWRVEPDGRMETTWTLRPGVGWHDATPITTADLLFTTELGRDKELVSFGHPAYAFIERLEAPDARTIRVHWSRSYAFADLMFTGSGRFALPLPKHLLEDPYRAGAMTLPQLPYWTSEYVGSGPYRLTEWQSASFARLIAFDEYILGRPRVDEIVVRFIRDANALQANLLAGEVDMTLGKTLSLEQALQVREAWTGGRVEPSPTNWVVIYPQFVDPNPRVIGSVSFREALLHAIDRQQLVDSLMAGYSSVAETFVTPDEADFQAVQGNLVRHPYDSGQSARLLEGLGYQRGPDGTFRDAGGQPLAVEIRANAGAGATDLFEKTILATADFWRKAGAGVNPVMVPPQQQGDRAAAANFSGFTLTRNPTDARSLGGYLSTNAQLPDNDYRSGSAGVNRARYMNPQFDALIERSLTTVDQGARLDLLREVVHHMTEQVIALGLFYDNEPTMIANRVQNATARFRYSTQAWNVQDWTVAYS